MERDGAEGEMSRAEPSFAEQLLTQRSPLPSFTRVSLYLSYVWNAPFQIDPTKRHIDKSTVAGFWRDLEAWIGVHKPGLTY